MGKLSKLKEAVDTALDMSKAARMERAKQMGFDRSIYHKTWGENFGDSGQEFTEFSAEKMQSNDYGYAGKGVYATPQPLGGSTYGNTTMPLRTNIQNPYVRTADNWQDDIDPYRWIPANKDRYDSMEEASAAWTDMMQGRGYDGFVDEAEGVGEIVVFDPSNIRSVNAAFDPAKKDSANLLAGMGAAAVGLGAMAPEEAEAGVGGKMSQELLSRLQKFDPNLDAVVRESADGIRLDKLVVPKEGRNSGTGSQFMDELTSYADETGSPVALSADGDYGGSKAGQNRFYGRHGFVRNKGKNKNFSFTESMIREVADKYGVSLPVAGLIAGGAAPQEVQAAIHKESTLSNFATRRAAKKEYWGGMKEQVKGRGAGYRNPNAQQDMINAGLETMAAVNRGAADTVDFIGSQVPNAILNLMGSDKRVNSIYDIPGVNQATAGNYMDEGSDREAIRFAGEMLSPL